MAGLRTLLALYAVAVSPAAAGAEPRTLVLAVDGVSMRSIERARELGAFAGWPPAEPMISTFPSMTNVTFTAMLRPFGQESIAGYERRYYDLATGRRTSGFERGGYGWRDRFDLVAVSVGQHTAAYMTPRKYGRKMMNKTEALLLGHPEEIVFVHVGSTDAMAHFKGDRRIVPFLLELSDRLDEMARRHEQALGRPLRIVLLSDHGNSEGGVRYAKGLRKWMKREAGLRFSKRLRRPGDVVAPMFGFVGFGLFHLDSSLADKTSRAAVAHEHVELAAWISAAGELTVLGDGHAEARVLWADSDEGRRYAYRPVAGDPLECVPALEALAARGALDAGGFADSRAWLRETAEARYPDPLRRLVDALDGTYVVNTATVMVSLEPGRAMGSWSARFGARLRSLGRMKGTHGALDRTSSSGFVMANRGSVPVDGTASAAEDTLVRWSAPTPDRER